MEEYVFSNDKQIQFISKRRIAFLMAWHPRLGEFSIISKFLNKDIGRLIAKNYITMATQCYDNPEHNNGIILFDMNPISIGIKKTPSIMKKFMSNMKLYKVVGISSNMCISNQLYIQLPEIELTYSSLKMKERGGGGGDMRQIHCISFTLDVKNKNHKKMVDKITHIEREIKGSFDNCKEIQKKTLAGMKGKLFDQFYATYQQEFEENENENEEAQIYQLNNVNVQKGEKNIYLQGNERFKYSFEEANEKGFLGRGSLVKALIKLVGVWDCGPHYTRRFIKWQLDQMLILRESDENIRKKKGCPIIKDEDDE